MLPVSFFFKINRLRGILTYILCQGSATCSLWTTYDLLCDFGICHSKEGKRFLILSNTEVNMYMLSKHQDKQSPKIHINETKKCCRCRTVMLKSCYSTKVHCSIFQTKWHLIKQYENYCGVNKKSFVQLTMTCYQNCLKATNIFTINSAVCRNTAIICFQVNTSYTLKVIQFCLLSMTLLIFLPMTLKKDMNN
jgi:hypothetical protein